MSDRRLDDTDIAWLRQICGNWRLWREADQQDIRDDIARALDEIAERRSAESGQLELPRS
jgi:hypothetical protein